MNLRDLQKYYEEQSESTCLRLSRTHDFLQIILIRHAKPVTSKKAYVNFVEAEELLEEYRNSSVHKILTAPVCIDNIQDVQIHHSDLTRARETARAIFPSEVFTHVEGQCFRELDRQNIKFPFKVHYSLHTTLSRLAWLMGTMRKVETPLEAKKRLESNATYLHNLVQKQKIVIVVAHGFHNYFVGKFLQRLGYTRVNSGGNKHLSVNIWAIRDVGI